MIYPYINKIIMFGPYIGDWKDEILSFRPYVKWVYDNLEFVDYYIADHFNRSFMYDFMHENNFIPIYESLTRDEEKQRNYIHRDIKTKDFSSIILRNIRDDISNKTGYLKRDIIQFSLPYVKNPSNFSILNKKFSKITYEKSKKKEKIVYIPDKRYPKKDLEYILNYLEKYYPDNYVVIGDKKTYFKDNNIIRNRLDYFENVYKLIIDYISNAKLVICPCGHWTVLSNQQGSYVISWGYDNISQYKTNGIYGFGNKNSIINVQSKEKLIKQIDMVIKKLIKE